MKLELPVVFDWETFGRFQNYEMSFHDLNHLYDVFEEEVTKRGYESMLYGSKFYLDVVWKDTDIRPIWLAHYTSWSSFEDPYIFWQVSDHGQIDGIDGHCDFNIMFLNQQQ